ncbi:Uma2 family endonuclease [uncultured Sphingomonas sp.]|uniref:Uma2 family endonuclease n=1 Tax=uncultured Sphingomonas sp. TaxID=158754 RepID=UPI0035C9549F
MTAQEAITSPQLAKLTVRDFLLLADAGAFERYARTELIEGEIWVVNAVHRRHARIHAQFTAEVGAALKAAGSHLTFYTAPSTELSDDSLPEPDIAIGEASDANILPGPAMRVAIEISDSTLDIDLGRKARLYARYGVPEYWVVDVEAKLIHQLWAPAGETYAERREVAFGEPIAAATVAGLVVETLPLS